MKRKYVVSFEYGSIFSAHIQLSPRKSIRRVVVESSMQKMFKKQPTHASLQDQLPIISHSISAHFHKHRFGEKKLQFWDIKNPQFV